MPSVFMPLEIQAVKGGAPLEDKNTAMTYFARNAKDLYFNNQSLYQLWNKKGYPDINNTAKPLSGDEDWNKLKTVLKEALLRDISEQLRDQVAESLLMQLANADYAAMARSSTVVPLSMGIPPLMIDSNKEDNVSETARISLSENNTIEIVSRFSVRELTNMENGQNVSSKEIPLVASAVKSELEIGEDGQLSLKGDSVGVQKYSEDMRKVSNATGQRLSETQFALAVTDIAMTAFEKAREGAKVDSENWQADSDSPENVVKSSKPAKPFALENGGKANDGDIKQGKQQLAQTSMSEAGTARSILEQIKNLIEATDWKVGAFGSRSKITCDDGLSKSVPAHAAQMYAICKKLNQENADPVKLLEDVKIIVQKSLIPQTALSRIFKERHQGTIVKYNEISDLTGTINLNSRPK